MSFNWIIYRELNPDLINIGLKTQSDFARHYLVHGKGENRKYNIYQLYPDFNPEVYRVLYNDLKHMSTTELELHWIKYGRYESRMYTHTQTYNKVSIVMAYHNRKSQTLNTLDSFNRHYVGKYNFEVIIVDDCSNQENRLDDILNNYNFKIIYRYVTREEKGNRVNPCIAYNIGFGLATGDVVIIQNPECYHYTDVMSNIKNLNLSSNYYTALVMSSPSFEHNRIIMNNSQSNIIDMINYLEDAHRGHPYELSKGWYNHPIKQRTEKHHLHFCSIISKQKLDILGGFDETYANNYWYDDDEFLFRIKKILTPCFMVNTLVIHLFHENGSASHSGEDFIRSMNINRKKYEHLRTTSQCEKINWR